MKHEQEPVARLLSSAQAVLAWCKAQKVPAALVGGIAVAIHGEPRATLDVDVLVVLDVDRWPEFYASATEAGFEQLVLGSAALTFAQDNGVMLFRHQATGIQIDVMLGRLPFEQRAVAHSANRTYHGVKLRVIRPEDLVVMKAIAGRAKDLADLQGLLHVNPKLPLGYVRQEIAVFAELADRPDMGEDFETLLRRQATRKPSARRKREK